MKGGAFPPAERFDIAACSRFGVRRIWSIFPATASQRLENGKTFPSPLLLVSEKMASYHFHQIYEFTT
ncbi:hypothetical protein C7476_113149 [Phyllobacterium bourgognense]|uniref:Uncharacterized protein n=1 Tax=Phyllobacterium bourgognense TaxID=314236 RepID=A0A368YKJ0_9HYPH|nr:hypothetical protein C7476_113149 [Phyllobacterium bourgognense]